MAVVLQALTVPPTASLAPIACSAVSARRTSVSFPEFRCLKIQSLKSTRSASRVGRGGRIVCEAQGAAVEVMASQENFQEPAAEFENLEDISPKQKQKSIPTTPSPSEISSGCCECNICLDSAREPVVTLCGHLYCWPCIYKWLHVQNSSFDSDNQPKCPVCKTDISISSLVPLYGRGNSSEPESKRPQMDPVIPSRPSALGPTILSRPNHQIYPNLFQQQTLPYPFGNHASLAATNLGGTTITSSAFSPTVGVFGEMIFAMMFRSGDAGLYGYPYGSYQNSYPAMAMGNGSPRMRRQVMPVEKSLNRLTIFFFCCFILCLLLF